MNNEQNKILYEVEENLENVTLQIDYLMATAKTLGNTFRKGSFGCLSEADVSGSFLLLNSELEAVKNSLNQTMSDIFSVIGENQDKEEGAKQ